MRASAKQLGTSTLLTPEYNQTKKDIPVGEQNQDSFLTSPASLDLMLGNIPDLYAFCLELLDTFLQSSPPYSALQFVPVLKKMRPLNKTEVKKY
jgi:hypothetical protein